MATRQDDERSSGRGSPSLFLSLAALLLAAKAAHAKVVEIDVAR